MLRIILGVIAGFILWSIVWVGGNALLNALSPGWYGQNMSEFQQAVANGQPFMQKNAMMLLALPLSVICSFFSGLVTAAISKENTKAPLILGILLLLVGLPVEILYWNYIPIWYHLAFLLLLIPVTVFGGKIRKA